MFRISSRMAFRYNRSHPYRKERQDMGLKYCPDKGQKYKGMIKVGQGTYGEVWKAKCLKTNQTVALKKILVEGEKQGFPITALREIKILQQLNHDNVVRLIEICRTMPDSRGKKR